MPGHVLVVGSINLDQTAVVERLPGRGETILGGELVVANGGKGANQAVAARRAGAEVDMVACVGDDAGGEAYRRDLAAEGVDTAHVRVVPGAKTGAALIFVERGSGENVIAVCPGANALVTPGDVEAARERIASAAVVVAQLEVPLETVARAAALCREVGTPFLLSAAPVPAAGLPAELLANTSYLVCNETEVAQIAAGLGLAAEEAAARLVAGGMRAVIVTLGAEGCRIVEAAGETELPGFAVEPVDTVGAGDAFTGAFAAALSTAPALSEGWPLPDCARFANAAGALATTKRGAMPSLPRREEIEGVLNS